MNLSNIVFYHRIPGNKQDWHLEPSSNEPAGDICLHVCKVDYMILAANCIICEMSWLQQFPCELANATMPCAYFLLVPCPYQTDWYASIWMCKYIVVKNRGAPKETFLNWELWLWSTPMLRQHHVYYYLYICITTKLILRSVFNMSLIELVTSVRHMLYFWTAAKAKWLLVTYFSFICICVRIR